MEQKSNIIIYITEDGLTKIETTFDEDTVWLSLNQMAELFQRDKSTISRHIKNVFSEGELVREADEGEGKVPLDNIAKRAKAYKSKGHFAYKMIKEYIEAKYGFKVHTTYITEVKRGLGLLMYDALNAVEELSQPRKYPTAEKVEAIKDALKYYEIV